MDALTRRDQAKSVTTNPVFQDAFKMLEAAYKDQMAETAIEDVQGRNKWHSCLFVLNDVKTSLEAMILNGDVEMEQAKLREKMKNDSSGPGTRGKQSTGTSTPKA